MARARQGALLALGLLTAALGSVLLDRTLASLRSYGWPILVGATSDAHGSRPQLITAMVGRCRSAALPRLDDGIAAYRAALRDCADELREALGRRPADPVGWLHLAILEDEMEPGSGAARAALRLAAKAGPFEASLAVERLLLALRADHPLGRADEPFVLGDLGVALAGDDGVGPVAELYRDRPDLRPSIRAAVERLSVARQRRFADALDAAVRAR